MLQGPSLKLSGDVPMCLEQLFSAQRKVQGAAFFNGALRFGVFCFDCANTSLVQFRTRYRQILFSSLYPPKGMLRFPIEVCLVGAFMHEGRLSEAKKWS